MVIYLDQYRKAKTARGAVVRHRRDEELRCVNWTPTGGMSAVFCYRDPRDLSPELPDDIASIDVEAFINRVYGLATQI